MRLNGVSPTLSVHIYLSGAIPSLNLAQTRR